MNDEIYSIGDQFGDYSVSNYGNVINKKTGVMKSQHFDKTNGTLCVTLFKDYKKRNVAVHRLVAMAFVDNPHYCNQVTHKDKNKRNNHYTNLEWSMAKHASPQPSYHPKYFTLFY